MRFVDIIFAVLAVAIASVRSQAIDTENVPGPCSSVCSAVVGASDLCEEIDDDNEDASDWVCVCAQSGMDTAIPECRSCLESAPVGDDDDDRREFAYMNVRLFERRLTHQQRRS